MDHDLVVREKLTEKYLLNELAPAERDEFEEHYFVCTECARDIHAASEFVEHSKVVLAENDEPAFATSGARQQPSGGWFAWLRPAFAAPALALLLLVVGYQNLVTYPSLRSAVTHPHVLPWAAVTVGTWGESRPTITLSQGMSFLVLVRIPPDGAYAQYKADLYNPGGELEWSLTIPATPGQDQWPVQVPSANRRAGTYKMQVSGITAAGERKDLGTALFDLQIDKL
jgi:Putative zinc-finger